MKNIYFGILFFLILAATTLQAQDRLTGEPFTTRSEILARNGMAATSQPLATQVALDILKKGGSAMDAAIAANAVLGLVEPASCGIGGDIFAIVWSAEDQKLYGFNGSGRAPKALSIDYFMDKGMKYVPFYGPLPVSVPGCVTWWSSAMCRVCATSPSSSPRTRSIANSALVSTGWPGSSTFRGCSPWPTHWLPVRWASPDYA